MTYQHPLCHFTAIHKSSPGASWDSKVSIECTLQNLNGSSRSSGDFSLTVFYILCIWTYYSLFWKFLNFEKVLLREQGLSEGHFYPELHLDPGFCGWNTPSTTPKFLGNVPAVETQLQCFSFFNLWMASLQLSVY